MTEAELRAAIVAACRAMNASGLNQGMSGNISVRHGDIMLITPASMPYDAMAPEDIAALPVDGSAETSAGRNRPSSEWRFHRDLLRTRSDIRAVVHAHAPFCTGLSIARRGIPSCHYMVAAFGGEDVRCARYETFGTAALSEAVLEAMQARFACLMANHGMIAAGRTLAQAMWRATELEALARQYHLALAAGGAALLAHSDISAVSAAFAAYRRT